MDISIFRRHAPAIAIFAFTLTLRLATTWRLHASPYGAPLTGDMRFYAQWAQRIANGELTDFHAFYGQPLYAYLAGALFSMVGFQPTLLGILQAVLDAGTALLIYAIGRLAFANTPSGGVAVGAIAAIGWALFVPSMAYGGLLIPASWTVFAWWFSVWWLLRRSRTARVSEWLALATFIGAIAMMSAAILFVLPLLAVAALYRSSVAALLAMVAGVIVGTAPAWIHNTVIARDPVFLSAHSGVNFWIGNNPEANGYPRVPRELPSEQAALLEHSIKVAETAAGSSLPRSSVSEFWAQKARAYIRAQPADWARLLATKAKNFWNRFEYDDLSSITPLRDAAIVPPGLRFGLIAALGLPGLLFALRDRRTWPVTLAVLLQMLALLPVFINERYRLAAAPGLLLLGASFLVQFWNAIRAGHAIRIAAAVALVVLSTMFVTLSPGDRALWSLNDYQAARRHVIAGRFDLGEMRMRRALEAMLGARDVAPAVANGFVEIAQEQLQAGDRDGALATLESALRINPASETARRLERQIAGSGARAE